MAKKNELNWTELYLFFTTFILNGSFIILCWIYDRQKAGKIEIGSVSGIPPVNCLFLNPLFSFQSNVPVDISLMRNLFHTYVAEREIYRGDLTDSSLNYQLPLIYRFRPA